MHMPHEIPPMPPPPSKDIPPDEYNPIEDPPLNPNQPSVPEPPEPPVKGA